MSVNLRHPSTADVTYTDEELEFLRAIDEYKRRQQRPFPTWREVLAVLRSLGWRKVAAQSAPPTFGARGAAEGPGGN